MSRIYYIHDSQGDHRANEADLPLRLGGVARAQIVIPELPADAVVALIALSEGHIYIQPTDDVAIYHNHERLQASAWLKSGDQLQVGDTVIDWTVKGDQVFISTAQRDSLIQPTPPSEPPPTDQPREDSTPATAKVPVAQPRYRGLRRLLAGLFAVLLLATLFVLAATPVSLRITPVPEAQSLRGFPPPVSLWGQRLTLPGRYTVHATRSGYKPLTETVTVSMGEAQSFAFQLQELPGRVTLDVTPEVAYTVRVDGEEATRSPQGYWAIERGEHRIEVIATRYLPAEHALQVEGLGKTQNLALTLTPAWAEVSIDSQPGGASVTIDAATAGVTPLHTELLQGLHTLELSLPDHQTVTRQVQVVAGTPLQLEPIHLPPSVGTLTIKTRPANVTVRVDGVFQGTSPATLSLSPRKPHRIQASKPGYQTAEREVTLAPNEERSLEISLAQLFGVVFLSTQPPDATLLVDGKPAGSATQRLRLGTRPHTLEIRKPGYATYRTTVTPRNGVSQKIAVTLKSSSQKQRKETPARLTTAASKTMVLIKPQGSFTMGSSRREAGRRANESPRKIELTRAFYVSINEVTNGEFRQFKPAHNAGTVDGAKLNSDKQPVVNVSWDDAARYCNWLSRKDGLAAAYKAVNGHMQPVNPPNTGYRLLSEAEWAYVARVHGQRQAVRYPWNGNFPPTAPAGNFADARIADTLADVVPGYDDNYRGTAPVGQFPVNPAGLYDLGGNVAEWTNDFYAVYPGEAQRLVRDPVGPPAGKHHVVRGSSWRHGNITELRFSYRDYSQQPRSDLGFRIARFAN